MFSVSYVHFCLTHFIYIVFFRQTYTMITVFCCEPPICSKVSVSHTTITCTSWISSPKYNLCQSLQHNAQRLFITINNYFILYHSPTFRQDSSDANAVPLFLLTFSLFVHRQRKSQVHLDILYWISINME